MIESLFLHPAPPPVMWHPPWVLPAPSASRFCGHLHFFLLRMSNRRLRPRGPQQGGGREVNSGQAASRLPACFFRFVRVFHVVRVRRVCVGVSRQWNDVENGTDFYATPTLTMLASVCGEGAFIFYFEIIFHAREKVVALKTAFPFWFLLYREEIIYWIFLCCIISIQLYIRLFSFFILGVLVYEVWSSENPLFSPSCQNKQIFHVVVTRFEGKRHPSSN